MIKGGGPHVKVDQFYSKVVLAAVVTASMITIKEEGCGLDYRKILNNTRSSTGPAVAAFLSPKWDQKEGERRKSWMEIPIKRGRWVDPAPKKD